MDARTSRLATLLLLAGSAGCVVKDTRHASITGQPVTEARLRAAPASQDGWLTYGRDWSNRRYVPLTEINRRTVTGLRRLWQYDPGIMFRRSVRNESTPIVVDDLLIYTDHKDLVIALDARTGAERWRYQPDLGATALCCGVVNRGVAVYGDRVYLATLDGRVIALDRRTGAVAWDVPAATPAEGYSFTMAPLAADGKIIVGASGGEFGIRGFVDAYDPATGKRLWRFWTIPSPEEGGWYGNWSRTTPDGEPLPRDIAQEKRDSARFADAWRKGGASVYSTPAYDPDLRLLYIATGNPSSVDGDIPPGDNLYSTSLVALDIATGALKWYYQMLPHNLWDFDAASPPVLFDLPAGDSTIPAVGHAGKTGWVYLLDRRTGRQVRRSDAFVPLENIFPTPTPRGTRTSPGTRGGANWPPPAYSPRTGLMYVLGSYVPMVYMLDTTANIGKNGTVFKYAQFSKLPDSLNFGTFSAIDVATGKIRWQKRAPGHLMYGGTVATEGGLVFYGDIQGYLNGLDAETGETVWRDRAAVGYVGPPISFQVDGHQRIAITSRRGVTVYGLPGGGRPP
jgi:PQQ-dependent dehydrogenase (methanol/ethanol family)